VKKEDLIAFARRDWAALAEVKREFQRARVAARGAVVHFEIVDMLRAQVHAQRPNFPSAEEREADLLAHVQLAERLRRASVALMQQARLATIRRDGARRRARA
jgi:hypothetical protein